MLISRLEQAKQQLIENRNLILSPEEILEVMSIAKNHLKFCRALEEAAAAESEIKPGNILPFPGDVTAAEKQRKDWKVIATNDVLDKIFPIGTVVTNAQFERLHFQETGFVWLDCDGSFINSSAYPDYPQKRTPFIGEAKVRVK